MHALVYTENIGPIEAKARNTRYSQPPPPSEYASAKQNRFSPSCVVHIQTFSSHGCCQPLEPGSITSQRPSLADLVGFFLTELEDEKPSSAKPPPTESQDHKTTESDNALGSVIEKVGDDCDIGLC